MEKLLISTQLLNQIFAYIGTRPYQEVFQFADALQKEVAGQIKKEVPAETSTEAPVDGQP